MPKAPSRGITAPVKTKPVLGDTEPKPRIKMLTAGKGAKAATGKTKSWIG